MYVWMYILSPYAGEKLREVLLSLIKVRYKANNYAAKVIQCITLLLVFSLLCSCEADVVPRSC